MEKKITIYIELLLIILIVCWFDVCQLVSTHTLKRTQSTHTTRNRTYSKTICVRTQRHNIMIAVGRGTPRTRLF